MRTQMLTVIAIILAILGCGNDDTTAPTVSQPAAEVVVTTAAFAQVCQSMLPDSISVVLISKRPDTEQIRRMQSSSLILVQGNGCESWLATLTLPRSIVFESTAVIKGALITRQGVVKHQHGPSGADDGSPVLTSTWTDPSLFSKQVEAVSNRLIDAFPDHTDVIQQRSAAILAKLADVQRMSKSIRDRQVSKVAIDNEEIAYFAAACGFRIVNTDAADFELTASADKASDQASVVFVDLATSTAQEDVVDVIGQNFERVATWLDR